ncbi:luciferase family protein [Streptomyces sp. T028]|uniref:luciferase domain-containing protein n=1 Tax=Streptomyces sp. T028 TaxID=3394379 RepID=UPI003A848ECF
MTFPALPEREGTRPRTGPEVPHLQLTQTSPPQIREQLRQWMAGTLPGTVTGRSEISAPDTWAVLLKDVAPAKDAVLFPPRWNAEFAHLHADGSLHLALDPADHASFLASGWGEKHPLYHRGVNVVMLYAPRDQADLAVAGKVIAAAYEYATGRAPVTGTAAA